MKLRVWWLNEGSDFTCKQLIGEYESVKDLNKDTQRILDSRPSDYYRLYFEEVLIQDIMA